MAPLLHDCLRYFLHIGQTLQESRRQQQRQAAVILQQQAAAAAAAASSSSASSAKEKPATAEKPKAPAAKPESTSKAGKSSEQAKDPSTTDDEVAKTSVDVEPSHPAPGESTDASKRHVTDDQSPCTSSASQAHDGRTRTEEGKGDVNFYTARISGVASLISSVCIDVFSPDSFARWESWPMMN